MFSTKVFTFTNGLDQLSGLDNHEIAIHYVLVSEQVTVQYEIISNGLLKLIQIAAPVTEHFNGDVALTITAPSSYQIIVMLDAKGNFSLAVPRVTTLMTQSSTILI